MRVTFAVEKTVKGADVPTVEIHTSDNTGTCGYPFKEGARYFVYGRKGSDGKVQESLCGPTTLIENATPDLAYAGEIESGKIGSRLYGSVHEDRQPTLQDKRTFEPVANIEVLATGEKSRKRFRTRTDAKGSYVLSELPDDIYRLTAIFPKGLREIPRPGSLDERFASINLNGSRCDSENFVVSRQGSIRGKVSNFFGEQIVNPWNPGPAQPYVSLIPLAPDNRPIPNRAAEGGWAYRPKFEFFFSTVPAGSYFLVMNPRNCPYPNNGVPRTYFPGRAKESDARIVTVKEGEQVVLEDFRALPVLNEQWFAGVVLNADRTPAGNVTVRLRSDMNTCGGNGEVRTITDEMGRFRVKGFEGYAYEMDAITERQNGKKTSYSMPVRLSAGVNFESLVLSLDKSF